MAIIAVKCEVYMKRQKFSNNNKQLELYIWDEVENPKGVLKITHGMAEHSGRYDDFAGFLNSNGYIVVMNDLRGHGYTSDADSLGYEEGDMYSNNVADQLAIIEYCNNIYKLPLFFMGHSYGSFITQRVIQHNPNVKGFILSGSNYIKGLQYSLCRIIAKNMCKRKGGSYPAELIAKMSFSQYDKKFEGTGNWLSSDRQQVEKYNDDSMCGFICSANFYRTFMEGIRVLYDKKQFDMGVADKPLLIFSGDHDPVGEFGKGVRKLYEFYIKLGFSNVSLQLYPNGRHEMLNEVNKEEVYNDVLKWLEEYNK